MNIYKYNDIYESPLHRSPLRSLSVSPSIRHQTRKNFLALDSVHSRIVWSGPFPAKFKILKLLAGVAWLILGGSYTVVDFLSWPIKFSVN